MLGVWYKTTDTHIQDRENKGKIDKLNYALINRGFDI